MLAKSSSNEMVYNQIVPTDKQALDYTRKCLFSFFFPIFCFLGKKSKPTSKVLPNMDDVASLLSEMSLTPALEKSPPSQAPVLNVDDVPLPPISLKCPGDSHGLLFSLESSRPPLTVLPNETGLNVLTASLFTKGDTETCPNPCFSPVISSREEPLVSSPNISSLISDLNLSSIDWEATSFGMSPQTEFRKGCNEAHGSEDKAVAPEPQILALANSNQGPVIPRKPSLKNTANQKPAFILDSPSILHTEKLPLRERILLKNARQTVDLNPQKLNEKNFSLVPVPKVLDKQQQKKCISENNCDNLKENVQSHLKLLKKPSPQKSKTHNIVVTKLSGTSNSAQVLQRPTTKTFSFVKKSTLAPVRNLSDSSLINNVPLKAKEKALPKKTVCHKIALSSEDEDEQSNPVAKSKTAGTKKMAPLSKMASTTPASVYLSNGSSDKEDLFLSPKCKSSTKAHDEQDSGDDSIISVDSPLPLSERLKLRLLQNC